MKNGINVKGNYHIFIMDELKYKTCMLSAEKSGAGGCRDHGLVTSATVKYRFYFQ